MNRENVQVTRNYTVTFIGRLIGALGITYRCAIDVQAENPDAAKLRIYDTHQDVSNVDVQRGRKS